MSDTATKGAEGESIRQKVADMMDYAEPFLEKFPRPEKGYAGLATKIRMCMNTMAEREMDTHKCYYAKSVLKEKNNRLYESSECNRTAVGSSIREAHGP